MAVIDVNYVFVQGCISTIFIKVEYMQEYMFWVLADTDSSAQLCFCMCCWQEQQKATTLTQSKQY